MEPRVEGVEQMISAIFRSSAAERPSITAASALGMLLLVVLGGLLQHIDSRLS